MHTLNLTTEEMDAIMDAVSNSDMRGDDRIALLDKLGASYDGTEGQDRDSYAVDEAIEAMKDGQPVRGVSEDRDAKIDADETAIEKEAGE